MPKHASSPLTIGVVIGRFQPFHLGHLSLLNQALSQVEKVLVLIGSAYRARSVKNPWTYEERMQMIQATLPEASLHFAPIPDFLYDEALWYQTVQHTVTHLFPKHTPILFGHTKDYSSAYLHHFPNWRYQECPCFEQISATPFREAYLKSPPPHTPQGPFPPSVIQFLMDFATTPEFERLQREAYYLADYKNSWRHTPYPPIFSTVDALVIACNHLLLIQRKHPPGQFLYALPGGFLEAHERILDGLIRELYEETQLALPESTLRASVQSLHCYDDPDRSQIGRVLTHVGLFTLKTNTCPAIHAADDALTAIWYPLDTLTDIQDRLHDDHYQIIQHALSLFPRVL